MPSKRQFASPVALTPEQFCARRSALGVNKRELADLLGVHRQTVYQWEKEGHIPPWLALALDGLEQMERAGRRDDAGRRALETLGAIERVIVRARDDLRKNRL